MTGILLPGMKARIAHEDGGEADFGEAELFVPGPKVATGYRDMRGFTSDDQGRFL
jgi:acyl-CoA synthetase (AMP-forming)/AMP-acid ligase II